MRFDLKDITFLIYVRIDSDDRRSNLQTVLRHLEKHLDTNIDLWEVDKISRVGAEIKSPPIVNYRFVEDKNPIFHTTKYRNLMVRQCETPLFYVCDTDIIADPESLLQATDFLRQAKGKTLVYPYNGNFYNVPRNIRDIYGKTLDYQFLRESERKFSLWFQYSVGGIFGGRVQDFKTLVPDNEGIYGWAPDDKERYYRLKSKGFYIQRAEAPAYHLHHDRKTNSWHEDNKQSERNERIYLDTLGKQILRQTTRNGIGKEIK